MRNHDLRITKLEDIITPKRKTFLILDYESDNEVSWIEFDGKKFVIPEGANIKKFIEEKTKEIKGRVVACTISLSKCTDEKSIDNLTKDLSKDDFLLVIKGIVETQLGRH